MKSSVNFFLNRRLLIVTKHKKEKIIAPLFENELEIECFVSKQFDTDTLGTFTGEVPRVSNPLDTLRQKCLLAMELEGFDLAIATEGSFGNHPSVFFATANDELIMLLDKKNNIEIVSRVLSLNTNFNGSKIESKEDLVLFLDKVQFPSHAVILKDSEKNWNTIHKGITDRSTVEKLYGEIFLNFGSCFIETDMRALYNPSRMKIIQEACLKLLEKINSFCPECFFPGFGVVSAKAGLLCSSCAMPSRSTLAHIYQCQHCMHESEVLYPNEKIIEDPMYCDFCNP